MPSEKSVFNVRFSLNKYIIDWLTIYYVLVKVCHLLKRSLITRWTVSISLFVFCFSPSKGELREETVPSEKSLSVFNVWFSPNKYIIDQLTIYNVLVEVCNMLK